MALICDCNDNNNHYTIAIASNPGLPRADFISQPWRKIGEFLHGCEIKSGRGRPGFEATIAILLH